MADTLAEALALVLARGPVKPAKSWWMQSQVEPGNIDLTHRPSVPNPQGGTSTLYSTSFGLDGQEVLVPRVSGDGRLMSEDDALAEYLRTGNHLGKFSGPSAVEAANAAGGQIHLDQEAMGEVPVGPPAPRSVEVRPVEGRTEEPRSSLLKDLSPLIAAQLLDLITTEVLFKKAPGPKENNPLPGMSSTVGRVGWGALETALAHMLTKDKPKLRKATVGTVLPGLHGALSMNNAATSQGEDVFDMVMRAQH